MKVVQNNILNNFGIQKIIHSVLGCNHQEDYRKTDIFLTCFKDSTRNF